PAVLLQDRVHLQSEPTPRHAAHGVTPDFPHVWPKAVGRRRLEAGKDRGDGFLPHEVRFTVWGGSVVTPDRRRGHLPSNPDFGDRSSRRSRARREEGAPSEFSPRPPAHRTYPL